MKSAKAPGNKSRRKCKEEKKQQYTNNCSCEEETAAYVQYLSNEIRIKINFVFSKKNIVWLNGIKLLNLYFYHSWFILFQLGRLLNHKHWIIYWKIYLEVDGALRLVCWVIFQVEVCLIYHNNSLALLRCELRCSLRFLRKAIERKLLATLLYLLYCLIRVGNFRQFFSFHSRFAFIILWKKKFISFPSEQYTVDWC